MLAARAAAAPGEPAAPSTGDDRDALESDVADLLDPTGEPPLFAPAASGSPPSAWAGSSAANTALPPARDVIAAAMRAGGLAGDPAAGWRTRSRLSGLVPQVSARVGQDDTWREVADPTLGHAVTYGVTASWRLERLVFDPSELRIATVDVLRRRERRRLSWYVLSLYRSWRRTGNEDLAAQLDVVTDGWFSQHANLPESR